jgi:hypothetical protein
MRVYLHLTGDKLMPAQVIDNSGAILAELINVYKVKTKPKKSVGFASVGVSSLPHPPYKTDRCVQAT